ncbi:hypothetical protein ACIP1T_24010 [Pseudomonas japonica]|uniref:hypothetical protein n=1 Tax=Pseudomonas japonica TaxID=256466 RepID=UPI00380782C2
MNMTLASVCLVLATGAFNSVPASADDTSSEKGARGPVQLAYQPWSSGMPESSHLFTCPQDQIMAGRRHKGDENKDTYYRCAIATQNDSRVRWVDMQTFGPINEDDGILFSCPTDRVMVGRSHYGDTESGETWYRCATPISTYWDNDPMQVTSIGWSEGEPESDTDFTCPAPSIMIGRFHRGDENKVTQYKCGKMW